MLKPTRSTQSQCPSNSQNFGPSRQKCGLLRVEAQFGTKGIPQDHTKYDYVVSALDINTAEEVQSVLINPPAENKYNTLKKALIKTFGKSQAQKDAELLNLNGLGDKRPLAEAADRVWEARTSGIQQVFRAPTETHSANMKPPFEQNVVTPSLDETVFATSRGKRQLTPQQCGTTSSSSVCFYHQRFWPDARRCLPGCKFASLLTKGSKQGTSSSGNASASRWTCQRLACLIQTRFRFMTDTLVSLSWSTLVLTYQFFQPLHRIAGSVHLTFPSLPQMELPSRPGAHATSLWRLHPHMCIHTSFILLMLLAPFLVLTFSSLMNLSSTLRANSSCLLIRPLLSLTALIPLWLLQVCHCIHITRTLTFSIIFQNYSLLDLTPLSIIMVWNITSRHMDHQSMLVLGAWTQKSWQLRKQSSWKWKRWALSAGPTPPGLHPSM